MAAIVALGRVLRSKSSRSSFSTFTTLKEIKDLKLYKPADAKVLIVGDDNLSFSRRFAETRPSGKGVLATRTSDIFDKSINSADIEGNIKALKAMGTKVLPNVTPLTMENDPEIKKWWSAGASGGGDEELFDYIIYKHPPSYADVEMFLNAAMAMVTSMGSLDLFVKENGAHKNWALQQLADAHELTMGQKKLPKLRHVMIRFV